MKNIIAALLIISNLSLFSQIDLNISMQELSTKYSTVDFIPVKEWESSDYPNIKYFVANFGYQEYFYVTDSLGIINSCIFQYNKFRLPSLIMTYNEKYKVIKSNESWEYIIDNNQHVIITIELNEKANSNEYFITHALQFAN